MATISGLIHVVTKDGPVDRIIEPVHSDNFNLHLNEDHSYMIGIDQSTSCTGFSILSTDMNIHVVIDFLNSDSDKNQYLRDLRGFLFSICKGQKITLLVHEEPVPQQVQKYSSRVLQELVGHLKEWIASIPELEDAEIKSLYPQSWKSKVIDRDAAASNGGFKKRAKSKAAISEDVCKIFPYLCQYRARHFSKDYDCFDATGILIGWILLSHNEKGEEQIYGLKKTKHVDYCYYKYVDKELVDTRKDWVSLILGNFWSLIMPKYLAYNNAYTKYENVRMAASNNRAVVTVLPQDLVPELQWKFGFELNPEKVMIMFIIRPIGMTTKSDINSLDHYFEMKEVIR